MGNVMAGQSVTCSVNPQAGRELAGGLVPATQPKRLAIVGGGPAGLEAARVAALRGHTVDLYERGQRLGGVLEPAARAEFKGELHTMVDWWEHQVAELPSVHVHLGVEVMADSPELADADVVVVATGARATLPPIPGIDLPHVVDVLDFHLSGAPAGGRVVVCGGGLSGCDAALELAEHGAQVTIVEMLDAIAPNLTYQTRLMLLERLAQTGVRVLTNTRVTSVAAGAVQVEGPDGADRLPADTVIAAFGVTPDTTLPAELRAGGRSNADVRVIGDAVKPAKVGDAVHAGFELAASL
jgi:pyruvate/2-oxoglutarate dehydrogenase complex dihydrolipoamide dehydrogenase (E3) component